MARQKKTEQEKFKALQKKWYAKLAADHDHPDGAFLDIETGERNLKSYSTALFRYGSSVAWTAKRDYYQMAENFLSEYKFASKLEEIIWEYHANGISNHHTAQLLKKARIKKTNRTDVWKIVDRLRKSMYAMYLPPLRDEHE